MRRFVWATLLLLAGATAATAERGRVGDLTLGGLAREVEWPGQRPGYAYAVACNLADGATLAVRAGPGTDHAVTARIERYTTLELDTRERAGAWVRVVGGDQSHAPDGRRRAYKSLLIDGWAHDSYLCTFTD